MIQNKACQQAQQSSVTKKPSALETYTRPILTVYGDVRKLTLGSTGTIGDGAGGTKRPK